MKNILIISIFFLFALTLTFGSSTHTYPIAIFDKCSDNLNRYCLYGYIHSYMYMKTATIDLETPETEDVFSFNTQAFLASLKEKINEMKNQKDHLNYIIEQKRALYQLYDTVVFGRLTSPTNINKNYHPMHFQRFEGMGLRLRL